jgi:hypothetical protein
MQYCFHVMPPNLAIGFDQSDQGAPCLISLLSQSVSVLSIGAPLLDDDGWRGVQRDRDTGLHHSHLIGTPRFPLFLKAPQAHLSTKTIFNLSIPLSFTQANPSINQPKCSDSVSLYQSFLHITSLFD